MTIGPSGGWLCRNIRLVAPAAATSALALTETTLALLALLTLNGWLLVLRALLRLLALGAQQRRRNHYNDERQHKS
jgi:hypothetical protein